MLNFLLFVFLLGISVPVYAYFYGISFALAGIILLSLCIHECGHIMAVKKYDAPYHGVYFIPLVGAIVRSNNRHLDQAERAMVFLMGPIFGLVMVVMLFVAYMYTKIPLIADAVVWVGVINTLNLLPLWPLDGGKVVLEVMPQRRHSVWLMLLCVMSIIVLCMLAITINSRFFWVVFVGSVISALQMAMARQKSVKKGAVRRGDAERAVFLYLFVALGLLGSIFYVAAVAEKAVLPIFLLW